jgi:hypothetical protein
MADNAFRRSRLLSKQPPARDREASVLGPRKQQHRPVVERLGDFLSRLDRSAENLNPILLLVVIGLAILDLSVFAALELSRLPRY